MELLVAAWTVRLALVAALVVGGLTLQAGLGPLEAALRAAFAAALFTTGGRIAIGLLETPEERLRRLRARREQERARRAGRDGGSAERAVGGEAGMTPGTPAGAREAVGRAAR
ncbi:MAG TPA: hypothetical protein VNO86_09345 [Candidatus Binatia bacterium]|nr:hypothetical protein [Candidatus Binatia bacterium]